MHVSKIGELGEIGWGIGGNWGERIRGRSKLSSGTE